MTMWWSTGIWMSALPGVRAILTAERQRRERITGLFEFVRSLQGE